MAKHYHLIGIGGIGMSGIAHLLLRQGVKVSGSDLKESAITDGLKRAGAQIFLKHEAQNIQGADAVVYSSAITDSNPEFSAAKSQKITLLKRAQALAELMSDKTVITVAGSHGKTTTTSLVSVMLLEAGLKPTVAIGGILRNIDTNAYFGDGEFFVAEADESDGSFLYYRPKYSIITNIDHEHLDYYKDFQSEVKAFGDFVNRTQKDGCIFACSDDANLKNILKNCKTKHVFFGLKDGAGLYAKNIRLNGLSSEFDCYRGKELLGRFELALAGEHNVSNALSVIALGLELGINLGYIKKAFQNYKGAKRRLEIKFSGKDYCLIDDYAHHPTEIKATLSAAKNLNHNRLIAVFQPHRYTRTKLLLEEFSLCFDQADYVVITDIYAASEPVLEGVSAKNIVERILARAPEKKVLYLRKDQIHEHVLGLIKSGDLVLMLGAGDIIKVCDELADTLKK